MLRSRAPRQMSNRGDVALGNSTKQRYSAEATPLRLCQTRTYRTNRSGTNAQHAAQRPVFSLTYLSIVLLKNEFKSYHVRGEVSSVHGGAACQPTR